MAVPGRKASGKSKKSDEGDLFCVPCDLDGDQIPAFGFCQDCKEHLCQTCYNSHRKSRASRTHVLLDQDNMPTTVTNTVTRSEDKCQSCTVPCTKHVDKMIEFFCQDHGEVFCYVCSTVEHRSCKVDYIPDVSSKYVESKEFKDKIWKLETLLNTCDRIYKRSSESADTIASSHAIALNEIDEFRKEINDILDEMQTEIKHQSDELKKTNLEKVDDIAETCSKLKADIKKIKASIDELNDSQQTDRLFIELIHLKSNIEKYKSTLNQQQTFHLASTFKFLKNERIGELLTSEKSLGILRQSSIKLCVNNPVKATFVNEINVKAKGDQMLCGITGIAVLSPDTLVVADHANKAVKIVDAKSGNVTSRLVLSSWPWDVAALPDKQVAVSINDKTIQVLSTKGGLAMVRSLCVDGSCSGITYARGQLVVTFKDSSKYQIISLQGDVLFTSSPDLGLSRYPYYVAVSKDERYILVSDDLKSRVITLSWEGKCLKSSNVSSPRGVLASEDGSLIVCCRDKHIIYSVSEEDKMIEVLKDSNRIRKPYAICYDCEGTLYVSCRADDAKYNNSLKAFTIE